MLTFSVGASQEEVAIVTQDHYQPIEVRFANGSTVRLSVRSMAEGDAAVTATLSDGQTVTFSAIDPEFRGLSLESPGSQFLDGRTTPAIQLPPDHTLVIARGGARAHV